VQRISFQGIEAFLVFRFTAVLILALTVSFSALGQRRLTTDDLFRLEEIGELSLSPNGKWLAYVLKRPKISAQEHKLDFLDGNDRGDIWVVDIERGIRGNARNITSGHSNGFGYWNPVWSPDNRRLALLSTKGGNVCLWIWDVASGRLVQASNLGIQMTLKPTWMTSSKVIFAVLPKGEKPSQMISERRAAEAAMREWPKAWKGQEATASVIESGVPSTFKNRPQGQLLSFDAELSELKVIATGNFRDPALSPDKKHLALLQQIDIGSPTPSMRQLDRVMLGPRYGLAVLSAQGAMLPVALANPLATYESVRWSPDGSQLALFERGSTSSSVYRYEPVNNTAQLSTSTDLSINIDASPFFPRPRGLVWSAKRNLVVRGKTASPTQSTVTNRWDWWLIELPGKTKNITGGLKSVPAQILAEINSGAFVGIADGDLWRINPDGKTENLTGNFEPKVTSIEWPTSQTAETEPINQLIVRVAGSSDSELFHVDLESGNLSVLLSPDAKVELSAFHPSRRLAAFTSVTRDGNSLWVAKTYPDRESRLILKTNTYLSDIDEGKRLQISYRSLDGQELNAWLTLPPGYQKGRRYPMIADVYAGRVLGHQPTRWSNINFSPAMNNIQLLAGLGYVVLEPSMPLKPYSAKDGSDPFMELTKGVIPAVEKAIELGIADPKRLGLIGTSFGGYSTYGIVAQTNRFQAAVALMGPSNLTSFYGVFDARRRFNDVPDDNFVGIWSNETGQSRMVNPPWKDVQRYVRNSPVFYADRVETPLMIIQGDMDYVPVQQGEEFFTALYRQGKRAAFVRYWGEGHGFDSPANIRNALNRTTAWFDEFLDITRDDQGNLVWQHENVRSRNGGPPLGYQDFARFDQMVLEDKSRK